MKLGCCPLLDYFPLYMCMAIAPLTSLSKLQCSYSLFLPVLCFSSSSTFSTILMSPLYRFPRYCFQLCVTAPFSLSCRPTLNLIVPYRSFQFGFVRHIYEAVVRFSGIVNTHVIVRDGRSGYSDERLVVLSHVI